VENRDHLAALRLLVTGRPACRSPTICKDVSLFRNHGAIRLSVGVHRIFGLAPEQVVSTFAIKTQSPRRVVAAGGGNVHCVWSRVTDEHS
jgi:hypothetical protein